MLSNIILCYSLISKDRTRHKYSKYCMYAELTAVLYLSGIFTGVYLLVVTFLHRFNGLDYIKEYIFLEQNISCFVLLHFSTSSILLSCVFTFLISMSRYLVVLYPTENNFNF